MECDNDCRKCFTEGTICMHFILMNTVMTKNEISEKYGIPKRTIENWVYGKNKPPQYVINLLYGCILHSGYFDFLEREYEYESL